MKGFIIAKDSDTVTFSYEFKERWLERQDPYTHHSYDKIMFETDIPVDDEEALYLFEGMNPEWCADGCELEMYEVPDEIFEFILVDDYKEGQKLIIDWKAVAQKVANLITKKDRLALMKALADYEKFLEEEFP